MTRFLIKLYICIAACLLSSSAMAEPEPVAAVWIDQAGVEHTDLREIISSADLGEQIVATTTIKNDTEKLSFLIFPPFWDQFTLVVDGVTLASNTEKFRGNIFRSIRFPLPRNNAGIIKVEFKYKKYTNFFNFKGETVFVTSGEDPFAVKNVLINDMHAPFIGVSAFLAVILGFLGFHLKQRSFYYLGMVCLSVIPHNLLGTNFLVLLGVDTTTAFKFHLASVSIFTPALYLFIAGNSRQLPKIFSCLKPKYVLGWMVLGSVYVAGLVLFAKDFQTFMDLIFPLSQVGFGVTIAFVLFGRFNESNYFLYTFFISLTLFTLASDIMHINLYLFAHGMMLLSLAGAVMIISSTVSNFTSANTYRKFVQNIFPPTLNQKIEKSLDEISSLEEFCSSTATSGNISIVLVDICDWGIMNHTDKAAIPAGLLLEASTIVFRHVEKIALEHDHELSKAEGDGLVLVGGIYSQIEPKILANRCLLMIQSIIEGIDTINADLRSRNLPNIKIKVAGTMGISEYGISKFERKIQFDVIGNYVNAAYRISSAMDKQFYTEHGRNCALVSQSLISFCEDLDTRKNFQTIDAIQDKHGITYDCFIYKKTRSQLSKEKFAEAMYGLFAHKDSADLNSNIKEPASAARVSRFLRGHKAEFRFGLDATECEILQFGNDNSKVVVQGWDADIAPASIVQLKLGTNNQKDLELPFAVKDSRRIESGAIELELALESMPRKNAKRMYRRYTFEPKSRPEIYFYQTEIDEKKVFGKVCDISCIGLGVEFRKQDVVLVQGMRYDFYLCYPDKEPIKMTYQVRHSRELNADTLLAGLQLISNVDADYVNAAIEYLVQNSAGEINEKELVGAGFTVFNEPIRKAS